MRGNAEAYLRLAKDYAECGFYKEAEASFAWYYLGNLYYDKK